MGVSDILVNPIFSFKHVHPNYSGLLARWNTPSAMSACALYLPLKTTEGSLGVIGVKFDQEYKPISPEEHRLLETFVNQIAITLERRLLSMEVNQAKLLRENEKLQTALLNSVSHDLCTPLASISGSLSVLIRNLEISDLHKKTLVETAVEEADKLNKVVMDLLDMARLEAGGLEINFRSVEVRGLIQTTLESMRKELAAFQVSVAIPENLPDFKIDFPLMLRVISNILDNAAKYSGGDRRIEIAVERRPDKVDIHIADRGLSIAAADLGQVLYKLYRTKRSQRREGIGLGYSVCKGIVEARGGRILKMGRG